MDRERQLQRYALALSLVADPDVAGDLFMDARDEADLIRRAARWSEARREGPADPAAPLPPLTADQEAHALHLARRAALRRRSRRVIGVAGAVLALLSAGALLLHLPAAPVRGKPAPAPPEARAVQFDGLALTTYAVETTPGTVAVTWGARWNGAGQPVWRPVLVVGSQQYQRVRPLDTQLLSTVPGQVKARSVFRAVAQQGSVMWLTMETGDDRDIVLGDLSVTEAGDPPPGATLAVGKRLYVGPDRQFLIESVTLTPDYTEVRYVLPDALAGAGWPHAEVELTLQAGDQTLRSYGLRDLSANGAPDPERAEYFPPMPAASAFQVAARVYPPVAENRFVYRFDDTGAVSEWHRTSTGLVVTVAGVRTLAPAGGFVTDAAGGQYGVDLDCVTVVEGRLRRSVRVEGFPTDARPVTLTLVETDGAEPQPVGVIEVSVPVVSSQ